MDSELSHKENIVDQSDFDMITNLLHSVEAEGGQHGPVSNIMREMGICPPRLSPSELK